MTIVLHMCVQVYTFREVIIFLNISHSVPIQKELSPENNPAKIQT